MRHHSVPYMKDLPKKWFIALTERNTGSGNKSGGFSGKLTECMNGL